MLGLLAILASIGTAIAAGLGYFSFWWTLIPSVIAALIALKKSPEQYARSMEATRNGQWHVLPLIIGSSTGMLLIICAVIYWIVRLLG